MRDLHVRHSDSKNSTVGRTCFTAAAIDAPWLPESDEQFVGAASLLERLHGEVPHHESMLNRGDLADGLDHAWQIVIGDL
jgi:hypothetical protein